ncbi:globin domain-containing protein [Pelagibaculum spongiae]|uniref:Globin domain-containing protein n=1 Tax=Pelagibaculum spongiae TaxID=2080658 RepID=A0A2V1H1D9_9GAMM|nr:globin domain-containing protein [Pelagibaculum spongiae]PVZ69490.1 hypothetical protein DC094_09165 [Pelagibaculum spongiae]
MNNQQKSLIAYSWHHASKDPEKLGRQFYNKLFLRHPELAPLFPKDLEAQQRKLMESISMLILGLDELDNMLEQIQELGERHHLVYQAKPEYYTLFGQVLIETIAQAANSHWSDEIENAWQIIYQLVTNSMLMRINKDL